jgi:aquaporin Z
MSANRLHWPEYVIEAAALGVFMVSAVSWAALTYHPRSPLVALVPGELEKRVVMGVAMAFTAAGLIYSPWGQRSGAHLNPAVTLTFYRLGKVAGADAVAYVVAQFIGGVLGIAAGAAALGAVAAHPRVNYVATLPGPAGWAPALAGEAVISFLMMLTVLTVSNHPRFSRFTGLSAAALVCAYIIIEAPVSGMSMNPARSFGPALLVHSYRTLWIYFTAPPVGMLLAAALFVRRHGLRRVRCAKLHHPASGPCIFKCGYSAASPMEIPS